MIYLLNVLMTCVEGSRTEVSHVGVLFDAAPGPAVARVSQEELILCALQQTAVNIGA